MTLLPDSQEPVLDVAEIEGSLATFHPNGRVFEIRVFDAFKFSLDGRTEYRPTTVAGYFDDPFRAALEIERVLDQAKYSGIYHTLNEINPALLARACNRLVVAGKMKLTSDLDVVRRRWLPIDIDPVRPAGVSSTDEEKDAAAEVAEAVREYLNGEGWPLPVAGDSGNGVHLVYGFDRPRDDDGYVKSVLAHLAKRFSNGRAKIDEAVFNPSRIWKVYGTPARKGDSIPDRPHRLARLIEVPE